MERLQIQLTEAQARSLRDAAAASHQSLAGVVRDAVETYLAARGTRAERLERARRAVGGFRSGRADVAANHDEHLAEAYGA